MWNGSLSGPTGNFGNGHENRARCCNINIRDAFCEPTSPLSRRNETHLFLRTSTFSLLKETLAFNLRLLYLDERARSWGPPVRTGNGLLHCPLHCGHVCNGLSKWSPLLTDQCLQRVLINARYRYVGHPYTNCPLSAGILEPTRIWQPLGAASWNQPRYGRHHNKETSQTHSQITYIGKARSHL
jgi:hypothetical protein